ncbi:MAG: TetR/AcrR family transcriptional regulator [Oscillospiraceae bacterium]|nr:TetR/AcrR family transcriptional regulator [Oscillospiraceae bacterium]
MDNQRVALSKRILKDALLELLKKKPLYEVSVSELCQASGINRTTFYRHYDNTSDLMVEIQEELLERIGTAYRTSANDPQSAPLSIEEVVEFFALHREYDSLFSDGSPVTEHMVQAMKEPISRELSRTLPAERRADAPFLTKFLLYGSLGIIREWVNEGRKESAADISNYVFRFCKNAVDATKHTNQTTGKREKEIWK